MDGTIRRGPATVAHLAARRFIDASRIRLICDESKGGCGAVLFDMSQRECNAHSGTTKVMVMQAGRRHVDEYGHQTGPDGALMKCPVAALHLLRIVNEEEVKKVQVLAPAAVEIPGEGVERFNPLRDVSAPKPEEE